MELLSIGIRRDRLLLRLPRVREAIAAGIVKFYHIEGAINPADMLSEHCAYPQFWPLLQPILFWRADFSKLPIIEDSVTSALHDFQGENLVEDSVQNGGE